MNKFNKVIVVLISSLFLSFSASSTEVKFGHVGKPGSYFLHQLIILLNLQMRD